MSRIWLESSLGTRLIVLGSGTQLVISTIDPKEKNEKNEVPKQKTNKTSDYCIILSGCDQPG